LLAAGAAGLVADRAGSLEGLVGVGALALAAGVSLLPATSEASEKELSDESVEERLPELAARLPDAVLRFDGGLALREWNVAAAALLGLDAGSVGARAEDLLGISVADLRGGATEAVTRGAVGGLDIVLHRTAGGITAVVRDPGARPEAERIGQELRVTIEELLRARRTIDLQRGELERSATVDPLTGLSTRGAILERLRLEVAQARRYRHSLAIALLDIDDFTEINRLYGHGAGDAVLREVALRFRLRTRQADALGRVGGDEMLAILPHTEAAGAATFADALRHRLAMRSVEAGDVHLPVTVSIGISGMRSGEDLELDGLLARGQEALDSARAAGGNRIALDRLHGLARLEDSHDADTPDGAEGADAV
jgi:diguanylate cyclase (GGDEF)-like protein